MSPALLVSLLLSALLATLPVRRLHEAGWTSGAKLTAWLVYAGGVVLSLEAGLGARYLVPVLVVLYVLPFVAGRSRLEKAGRLLGAARPAAPRPVINVTPPDAAEQAQPDTPPPAKRRGRKPPVEYR
jgi:hypothetical protein